MSESKTTKTPCILCKDCKYFVADGSEVMPGQKHNYIDLEETLRRGRGTCEKWKKGYGGHDDLLPNEVVVENDEGWAMDVGPEFGCVLGEVK